MCDHQRARAAGDQLIKKKRTKKEERELRTKKKHERWTNDEYIRKKHGEIKHERVTKKQEITRTRRTNNGARRKKECELIYKTYERIN